MRNPKPTVTRPDPLTTLRLGFLDDKPRPTGNKVIEMMADLKARLKASKPTEADRS